MCVCVCGGGVTSCLKQQYTEKTADREREREREREMEHFITGGGGGGGNVIV